MKNYFAVVILLPLNLSFNSAFGMRQTVHTHCKYKKTTQPVASTLPKEETFNQKYHSLQSDNNPLNVTHDPEQSNPKQ